MMRYFNKNIGPYPYKQYSVVQGGDGEWNMRCLLNYWRKKIWSLFGVTHMSYAFWFQHVLATNETKHEWMDEGFTTFISTLATNEILKKTRVSLQNSYYGYYRLACLVEKCKAQMQTDTIIIMPYESTAYSKGAVFLSQLGYIIGFDNLIKTLQEYYNEWKFKHPQPNDFRRIAERVSGIQLQWYLTDWTQTTNKIDYAIEEVVESGASTL